MSVHPVRASLVVSGTLSRTKVATTILAAVLGVLGMGHASLSQFQLSPPLQELPR